MPKTTFWTNWSCQSQRWHFGHCSFRQRLRYGMHHCQKNCFSEWFTSYFLNLSSKKILLLLLFSSILSILSKVVNIGVHVVRNCPYFTKMYTVVRNCPYCPKLSIMLKTFHIFWSWQIVHNCPKLSKMSILSISNMSKINKMSNNVQNVQFYWKLFKM